jgi:hypothetical protein
VTLGESYLELVLRLAKIAPEGVVDSYSGPPEFQERIEAEEECSPTELAEEARALALRAADDPDPARARWVAAQLVGIEASCLVLAGERIPFRELVRRCYDVRPEVVPDEVFAEAHARLDEALEGTGDVRERAQRWLASQVVPPQLVGPGLEVLAEHLREWTRASVGLPDGERVDLGTTTGERWFGFADYEGALTTRVTLNTDIPMWSYRLPEFVTHEIYPGHHTENVLKEVELIEGRGHLELAVFAASAQKALLTEGMADTGFEIAFGTDADVAAAKPLRPLGIPYDAQTAAAFRWAKQELATVGLNIRILLDEGKFSWDDARAYLRRWMLESDDYVERIMQNVEYYPWPPSTVTNALGYPLCRRWVAGDPARLRRLLAEQLTTADLAA